MTNSRQCETANSERSRKRVMALVASLFALALGVKIWDANFRINGKQIHEIERRYGKLSEFSTQSRYKKMGWEYFVEIGPAFTIGPSSEYLLVKVGDDSKIIDSDVAVW